MHEKKIYNTENRPKSTLFIPFITESYGKKFPKTQKRPKIDTEERLFLKKSLLFNFT